VYILGVNAYHPDSSACIIEDGKLIAAVEEERFTRLKHWSGFPVNSIKYCLKEAKIKLNDIDYIALNKDPKANLLQKIIFLIKYLPEPKRILRRLFKEKDVFNIKMQFLKLNNGEEIKPKIINVEHHLAHLASCFFVSNFNKAAIISVDGSGDSVTVMTGIGIDNKIIPLKKIYYPHSLGNLYLAITQFLGFKKYGDEYKVMGLSPYGKLNLEYIKKFAKIIKIKNNTFSLNMKYFVNHKKDLGYDLLNGQPNFPDFYSDKLIKLFGKSRIPWTEITKRHKDIAYALQYTYEKVFFNLLNDLYEKTKIPNLCIAGGCGMNSAANGKIFEKTPFKNVYIQAAAGDNGGSLGAAFYLYHQILKNKRTFFMNTAYYGPEYSNSQIKKIIESYSKELPKKYFKIQEIKSNDKLCKNIAKKIAKGKVVGWFQGRMELGARALGNRSIICDPRRKDMKKILNARIKKREPFRPFAPTILREYVKDFFYYDCDVPFMSQVFKIKKEKQKLIPAVTHVDGTARLQTLTKEQNPLYYKLIDEFRKITKIPVVLNTSFNENEPIVNTPKQALECFLRTKMDIIVMGNYVITRK